VIDPDIQRGMIKAAAAKELGITPEQLVALGEAQMVEDARRRRSTRGIRASDIEDAASFDLNEADVPSIIKEFDVDGGPSLNEYGLDQSDMVLKVDGDKDFTGKEQRRRDEYVKDLQYESEAKRGLFAEDFDEELTDKDPWHPMRNAQAELDDFVVKKKGVPLGFVKGPTGRYTKVSNDPDAKVKAMMAKRRGFGNEIVYDKDATGSSVNIDGLPRTTRGGFIDRNTEGELFYPGATNNGPNVGSGPGQSPIQSGNSNDIDMYKRLQTAVNTGQITDPVQLETAGRVMEEIKRRIQPGYDKAIIFDAGAKVAREDNARLPAARPASRRRADAESSVLGSFLPSNANFRGLGIQQVGLEGRMGGKKSYIKTVSARTQEELNNMPTARMVISPDDSIYGYADNQGNLINPSLVSDVDSPGNIPKSGDGPSTLMDVMELNQYQARTSGTYPQVDIGQQLGIFAQRLGKTGLVDSSVDLNVRNLEQAEALFAQAIAGGKAKGTKFNAFGKKDIVSDPGVMEMLAKMRYTSPEVAAFSNAMIQLELGNRNNVNLDRKNSYATTRGGYMPQHMMGYPHVDPNNRTGSVILGNDYIEFDRPDQMQDYQVGENISYANSRNAPQFRALSGTTMTDLPANEKAALLADAKRPYVGLLDGEDVPIAGKYDNPNYRFNSTGITNPRDIAVRLKAQAERRAEKNGRQVDRARLASNIRNNIAVTKRHAEAQNIPRTDAQPDAQAERSKRLAVQEHITRDLSSTRPHYKAPQKQQKYFDKSRTLEERIGANSLGISAPPPREEKGWVNATAVDAPNIPDLPEGYVPKSERKTRIDKIKSGLGSFTKDRQYQTGRRVGYGAAGLLGASAIAGLFSNNGNRREQEAQY
jgi:hypothetical protein